MTDSASSGGAVARGHRALAAASRVAIVDALRAADRPLDAREIADRVGLHVSTVRGHLDVLVDAGHVARETETRAVPGRPRVLYSAVLTRQPSEGDGMLAMILASHIAGTADQPAAQAEGAGRTWGRFLAHRPAPYRRTDAAAAVGEVVRLLDEMGFAPQARTEPDDTGHDHTVVDLRHCPFRDVAEAHPEVACAVHLGLLRGALDALDAPVEATALEPFVTPTLCRAHLREQEAADRPIG